MNIYNATTTIYISAIFNQLLALQCEKRIEMDTQSPNTITHTRTHKKKYTESFGFVYLSLLYSVGCDNHNPNSSIYLLFSIQIVRMYI